VVFSSLTFLFLFLPVFFTVYYLLPFSKRSPWILLASWFFYGWWRLDFLLLLVGSSLAAAFIGIRVHQAKDRKVARMWMAVGVTSALALLGYFKYYNFGVDTLSAVLQSVGAAGLDPGTVILPVGISFYIFQIISYIVDVYRGSAPVGRSTVDIAAYVSLFPQLVAGPIVRYNEIADQLIQRNHTWSQFNTGAHRFMIGLARKVLIADAVAPLVASVFAHPAPGFAAAWIGLIAYTLQIYFDFAAYSDMAIGMGKMMGFSFPENFDAPYHSRSIAEFWRRWHMTLSAWLRDYLYIPLGGSRNGSRRTVVNLLTVMVLGGLWHGASWTFVFWGLWHGVWLVLERTFLKRSNRLRTLMVVLFGWLLFRAESLDQLWTMLAAVVGLQGIGIPGELLWQFPTGALMAVLAGIAIAWVEPWTPTLLPRLRRNILPVSLFLVSLLRLLATSYSPFLYFQF